MFIKPPGIFIAQISDKRLLLAWTKHPPKDQRSSLSLGFREKREDVGTEQVNEFRDLRRLLKKMRIY